MQFSDLTGSCLFWLCSISEKIRGIKIQHLLVFPFPVDQSLEHRTTELFRLAKPSEIIDSNHNILSSFLSCPYSEKESAPHRASSSEGSLKISTNRKKQTLVLIKFIEMNPIQSSFTALQKIWSKQGGAHRALKHPSSPALWQNLLFSVLFIHCKYLPYLLSQPSPFLRWK